ncbi:hypothetical protein H696_00794 [Fonticula alba]|uniref:Protein RER1 n=1 Tax=Fonticula alba TaxID=691883 RepID=A0A058ZH40_FONAL|nr:hypothetical protein H696_00794 [Fonticula alba]KCV73253.1 hypothetical protein H696_00794 [Fonticula alba]|eukprot:XP_009492954.1 hypothetical protein H696_00794 [Fonticula alba]
MSTIGQSAPAASGAASNSGLLATFSKHYANATFMYRYYLDRLAPYLAIRWSITGTLFVLFALRVVLSQGFYIIAYALGIYMLNMFLSFLTPAIDPELDGADGADDPGLPTAGPILGSSSGPPGPDSQTPGEFRPFIRRLPEYSFWLSTTQALVLSLLLTTSQIFNIPVYWRILVVYFVMLFVMTMRRQISHMLKHRYLPFDFGKRRYRPGSSANAGPRTDAAAVTSTGHVAPPVSGSSASFSGRLLSAGSALGALSALSNPAALQMHSIPHAPGASMFTGGVAASSAASSHGGSSAGAFSSNVSAGPPVSSAGSLAPVGLHTTGAGSAPMSMMMSTPSVQAPAPPMPTSVAPPPLPTGTGASHPGPDVMPAPVPQSH